MQWTPPEAILLNTYPNLYVHPRLIDTFERPELKPDSVIAPPRAAFGQAASAVAGPSSQPMPGTFPQAPPSTYAQFANSMCK